MLANICPIVGACRLDARNAIVVLYVENKGYGVIDTTGKEIIEANIENERIVYINNIFIVVKKNGNILRYDKKGSTIK